MVGMYHGECVAKMHIGSAMLVEVVREVFVLPAGGAEDRVK